MTHLPQKPPAWVRFCVAALALVALLGITGVLPALHFAFVAHRVCAEHGALVDAGKREELDAPPVQAPSRESSLVAAPGVEKHAHEHCGVVVLGVCAGAPPTCEVSAALLPPALTSDVPAQARSAHVEIALLLYAPKLAPPA